MISAVGDVNSLLNEIEDGFGITLHEHDCRSDCTIWLLKCIPTDALKLIGKILKISRLHTVIFCAADATESPESKAADLKHIWYCSKDIDTTIPSNVSVDLVLKRVLKVSDVSLTAVRCEPKATRWEFTCLSTDVQELLQHAGDIVVLGTRLILEIPGIHNPAGYSDETSSLPRATPLVIAEEQRPEESLSFHYLREEVRIFQHLQKAFDRNKSSSKSAEQACVEQGMSSLHMHMDYERRFVTHSFHFN